jgi:hypothetical protein
MNRSSLRAMLKRRLYEPDSENDQWTTDELNSFLNEGYRMTSLAAYQDNPSALLVVARRNLVADQNEYSWPYDMVYDLSLGILNDEGKYSAIARRPLEMLLANDAAASNPATTYQFADYGRFFYLSPAPTASVTDGIQLTYVPALALSDDAQVPHLRVHWHPLIAINAQILALGESSDQATSAIAERNALYADMLGSGQRSTAGRPNPISVGIRKGYGRTGRGR